MNNIWPGRFARLRSQRRLPSAQTAPNHLHKNRSLRQQKPRAARCGSMGIENPSRVGGRVTKYTKYFHCCQFNRRANGMIQAARRLRAPRRPRRCASGFAGRVPSRLACDAGRPSPCRIFLGAVFSPARADQSNKISIPLDFMKRSSFRLALTSIWRMRSRVTP